MESQGSVVVGQHAEVEVVELEREGELFHHLRGEWLYGMASSDILQWKSSIPYEKATFELGNQSLVIEPSLNAVSC